MIELNSYQEVVDLGIESIIAKTEEIMSEPEDRLETFDRYFGGKFYIIQSEEDLKLPNIEDFVNVADSYDICEMLSNDDYLLIVSITNDAGGDGYFFPKDIVMKYENLFKSIQLTADYWVENWYIK